MSSNTGGIKQLQRQIRRICRCFTATLLSPKCNKKGSLGERIRLREPCRQRLRRWRGLCEKSNWNHRSPVERLRSCGLHSSAIYAGDRNIVLSLIESEAPAEADRTM